MANVNAGKWNENDTEFSDYIRRLNDDRLAALAEECASTLKTHQGGAQGADTPAGDYTASEADGQDAQGL